MSEVSVSPGYRSVQRVYANPSDEELQKIGFLLHNVGALVEAWRADKPLTRALYNLARTLDSYSGFNEPHISYTLSRWREWRDSHTTDADLYETQEKQ